LKIREFSAIFGIFAMCAFGLVFLGCSNVIESPPPLPTPTVEDFVIENLSQVKENITDVIIVPNPGKSEGAISVYYDGSPILPAENGAYTVTFDVQAATGWNAAIGLAAGTLIINDIIIDNIPDSETSVIPDPDLEASLLDYLSDQPDNNKDTPYYIAINMDNKSIETNFAKLRRALNNSPNKYVYLDLSSSSIWKIPEYAFYGRSSPYGCDTLVGITIPNSVLYIRQYAFCQLKNLASVIIGNNVDTIETGAFQYCTSLTSVIIPDSVFEIGSQAFRFCTNLISVTFQGTIYTKLLSNNIPFPPDLPYPNDLRSRFYAGNENYGTPGTYTRSGDGTLDSPYAWIRQP